MSIDRYLAVCHPFSTVFNTLKKEIAYYLISLCVWIIAIYLATPIITVSDNSGIHSKCECT